MATFAPRSADRPLVHLVLLAATVLTTMATYLVFHTATGLELFQSDGKGPFPTVHRDLGQAVAFSLTAIAILGSHEMGHYLAARYHRVQTSLPYFIPFPLGFGTLGAVIRIRSRIPTRDALVDIGASGPLVGVMVAIPLLYWGLTQSTLVEVAPLADTFPRQFSLLGLLPRIVDWVQERAAGTWQPGPMMYFYGDPLLLKALTYLVFGPLPEGSTVNAHPMVLAGWFGLLVTTLNLCPIGQLDGGHVSFAVFGRHAQIVGKVASWGLLLLTLFFSVSWLLWWLLTRKVIGFGHPEVLEPQAPLSPTRKVVSFLCLLALVGCLLPAPMQVFFQ